MSYGIRPSTYNVFRSPPYIGSVTVCLVHSCGGSFLFSLLLVRLISRNMRTCIIQLQRKLHILISVLSQCCFDDLHPFKDLFLLEFLPYDLYANRKPVHLLCVVEFVCTFRDCVVLGNLLRGVRIEGV